MSVSANDPVVEDVDVLITGVSAVVMSTATEVTVAIEVDVTTGGTTGAIVEAAVVTVKV